MNQALEQVPASERIHIGFFGARNAGKSSLVNALTGQEVSIVSDVAGTTTDAVRKSMELLPLGAVMITDTAGYDDDDAALGALRVEKTKRELYRTDIAVLVADAAKPLSRTEHELIALFRQEKTPFILALNKSDLSDALPQNLPEQTVYVSAKTGFGVEKLKEMLGALYDPLGKIVDAVIEMLRKVDDDMRADIVKEGILLTGGGIVKGMEWFFEQLFRVRVRRAPNADVAAVEGAALALARLRE